MVDTYKRVTATSTPTRFSPEQPGMYFILARGYLEESWSDYFGGMAIRIERGQDGVLLTTLTGELSDQAALMGVLNALCDRHAVVLMVGRLSSLQHREIVSALFRGSGL